MRKPYDTNAPAAAPSDTNVAPDPGTTDAAPQAATTKEHAVDDAPPVFARRIDCSFEPSSLYWVAMH